MCVGIDTTQYDDKKCHLLSKRITVIVVLAFIKVKLKYLKHFQFKNNN